MTPADLKSPTFPTSRSVERLRWRDGAFDAGQREIPEETAIALVHDASTTAVMMATPSDLEDFALGFSLTEGVVGRLDEIRGLDIVSEPDGIEVRMWLAEPRSTALAARRRNLAGPTGCGLCGVESLAEASRPISRVTSELTLHGSDVQAALAALSAAQPLGAATRAVHAAGFWTLRDGLCAAREDVGRHNALDKLAGALARAGRSASDGVVVLTSRVSVEMVQKTAMIGAPILVAVSAPTTLAIRTADAAGVTLLAVARTDGFEVFTHPDRIRR
jgi:FdhD protein